MTVDIYSVRISTAEKIKRTIRQLNILELQKGVSKKTEHEEKTTREMRGK